MASAPASSPIESEVHRIRELSRSGKHREALAAAEALANRAPQNRDLLYLIASNQRCLNRIEDALATLALLEQHHPRFSLLYQERGACFLNSRDAPRAIEAFSRAVSINPALTTSWITLDRLYRFCGDEKNAAVAAEQISILRNLPSEIVQAGSLFSDGALSAAEDILGAYLAKAGDHVEALRLLARIKHQRGALDEAEPLLESVLKLAPNYSAARADYARLLIEQQKYPQVLEVIETLLAAEPRNPDLVPLRAAVCVGLRRQEEALGSYRRLLRARPESPELHVALGHSLRSLGRRQDAIDSYQKAAALRPNFGDAYWSLANLKDYRFSQAGIARMRAEEAAPATSAVDQIHLCFALGKAYEDRDEYADSWRFYERGNKLKRTECRYDPEAAEAITRRQIEVCNARFFAERAGVGAPHGDPIFVVGLPRSGSTLLEQILASHSQVEGTQELPDIHCIAREIVRSQAKPSDPHDPNALAALTPEDFHRFGESYIASTRHYRSAKPFFIDKMPNNFRHIGLIHLILPNAKIIDARREPMACCFSNFKQLFAGGQEFTYSIDDIARYYRNYLDLMCHWDAVLPAKTLRVRYEDVVQDLETNVRRILDFCGLLFEPGCLRFHKTERSVGTPSSEQVRQPIFHSGLTEWRKYRPWLTPLKVALGDALIRYRE
jgi:tetratricopeptide (TPR) repeat protein